MAVKTWFKAKKIMQTTSMISLKWDYNLQIQELVNDSDKC